MTSINNQPPDVGMHPGASVDRELSATSSAFDNFCSSDRPNVLNLPRRKNIRAEFHNYSGGEYFITICTRDKEHYFGRIKDGKMFFSEMGRYAYEAMSTLSTHYSYVEVPLFVVMPNHVHAVIVIRERADAPGCIPTVRTALGVVVGGYKQSVTRYARRNNIDFGWQGRYHDHIIRGVNDGNKIADYIENNVVRWDTDCFNNKRT